MSLSAKTNQLTGPAVTGNQATTDPGFQSKGLLIFNGLQTATGATADAQFNIGFASSTTTEKAVGYNSDDNVATSDSVRVLNTARLIDVKTAGTTTNNIVADLTSLDATGFTSGWSTLTTTSPLFNYLALGGADITNVMTGNFTADSTNASQSVTGVGFQPDVVLLVATLQNTSGASNNNNQFSLGVATANGDQWATSLRTQNSQATMNTTRAFHNTRCLVLQSSTTNNIFHEMTLTSMDSDGFSFNIDTQGGLAFQIAYIAIKGGQWKVGTETQKTSTGTKATTGVGFTPKGVIFASACDTQTAGTADHARLSFGAATSATQNTAIWTGDRDAVADSITNTIMSSSKCLVMATEGTSATPTINAEAEMDSLDSDGFTLDWTTADATARVFGYVVFGDTAGAPPSSTNSGFFGFM
jgi:hypothetical protein